MFKWGVARNWCRKPSGGPCVPWKGFGSAKLGTEPDQACSRRTHPVVEPYVTPQIWAMVNLQLWTGCRPGEACLIRGIDLNMEGTFGNTGRIRTRSSTTA